MINIIKKVSFIRFCKKLLLQKSKHGYNLLKSKVMTFAKFCKTLKNNKINVFFTFDSFAKFCKKIILQKSNCCNILNKKTKKIFIEKGDFCKICLRFAKVKIEEKSFYFHVVRYTWTFAKNPLSKERETFFAKVPLFRELEAKPKSFLEG